MDPNEGLLEHHAAGIFELVFKPVFPEIQALDSPLLNQYRKHILTKDRKEALRQLDLIALKSITSEEHFETEVIPDKAKSLAEFILPGLQFFLLPESRNIDHSSIQHKQEISAVAQLQNTLCQALYLKVELALSNTGFKFIFFKPGDPFDANSMQWDSSQAGSSRNSGQGMQSSLLSVKNSEKNACIKPCLLPALYALPSQKAHEKLGDSALHFATSYNKCVTEAAPEDLESLSLVAKAVVLV
ncbi:hypothetical protein EDB81DRAFT_753941 [Dactylonectria macrodidyma]|uniref:Uncharacterized protein n=1 Tax=Dactylonectria macrodidyma TaxID=307937 RepID=A0A9P9JM16_9HYPO|nr:hypothetical protein EDB81DRAFT_753941 [Dactylonectria macrodidyma]